MMRKTIPVERVKEIVNNLLANSTEDVTPAERVTVAHVLEIVLMETGNYKGFGYVPGTYEFDDVNLTAKLIGDESRRQYY
jgi:hypothetical protein